MSDTHLKIGPEIPSKFNQLTSLVKSNVSKRVLIITAAYGVATAVAILATEQARRIDNALLPSTDEG